MAALAQTVDYGTLETLFNEPVTTSASGKPQKASEAPVALDIITAEQIRRMGVRTLPEVLNRINGVTSWQPTYNYADVGIRGQNSPFNATLLVLLNGRQVYNDVHGYTDWELIPVQLDEIRQVEIVKGPVSALYGFNAAAGVINIITYNPKYDNKTSATITGGSQQTVGVSGSKTMKLADSAHMRVSASHDGNNEADKRSPTKFAETGAFNNYNTNNKFLADSVIQLTDKADLRVETSYSNARNTQTLNNYQGTQVNKHAYSAKMSLTADTDSSGLIEGNIYINQLHESYDKPSSGVFNNQVIVAQLQDLFKIGTDHTLRLQAEARHNSVSSSSYVGPDDADVYYNSVALGTMWDWSITPDLEWTNAVRVDNMMLSREGAFNFSLPFNDNEQFDRNIAAYGINSGLVWKASDRDVFGLSYGRGIQAPSLLGLGFQLVIPSVVVVAGNPGLDPTIQQNYELSYDRKLTDIDGAFHSAAFYRTTENINALSVTGTSALGTFIFASGSTGDSATAGLELAIKGKIGSNWAWDAGYTYQNTVDDMARNSATNARGIVYEDTVPHHVLKAHAGYTNGPWEADIYGEAGSEFKAAEFSLVDRLNLNIIPLDGYYTAGGRIGYNFENGYTVALMGSNLTSPGVADNYGLYNDRRAFLVLSKKF